MPKNESIRDVVERLYRNGEFNAFANSDTTEIDIDTALAEIKRIVKEKIKSMKWTYAHDSACSCASCANAVYRNVMLDRVVEMVEEMG